MSKTAQSLASNRIASLLDENSFVEIGGYITARSTDFNMQQTETPSDGVITGYGVIDGNLVYVYSQDASVLKGSIGEMHAKKISGIYDLAMKMGAPVIGLIDCAGLRLQEATDALEAFGEIYQKQSLASGVIPQITAVFGNCGGGLAVIPTLTDFTFMEENARLFVNSPNVLDGSADKGCDTASAAFQSSEVGNVDVVGDETTVLGQIRQLVMMLPMNNEDDASYELCTDDLNRICAQAAAAAGDASIILRDIADGSALFEMKADYAKEMVTGFIKLNGVTVGAVANRTSVYGPDGAEVASFEAKLTTKGCKKAADFISFCDAFGIPVLSLTNAEGYKADSHTERSVAKACGQMIYAFANATVPKVNVIIGKAYGSAYTAMNSKSLGADLVYAWEDAEIGMMDAKTAALIMYAEEGAETVDKKAEEYKELQLSAVSAAKRGYVDDIIRPEDTRKYLIGAFEMLFTKREERPAKKHGTV